MTPRAPAGAGARLLAILGALVLIAGAATDPRWVDHPLAILAMTAATGLFRVRAISITKFASLTFVQVVALTGALAAGVARDHARCAEERWEAAGPGGRARAEAEGVAGILRETGIGGVRDRAFVKCLHAQVAFHLARGGAVGALLAARHRLEECDPGSVRCDAYGVKVPGRGDRTSR